MNVTVWNEFVHEKEMESVAKIYPNGIHGAIADFLKTDDVKVTTATLDQPECGLTQEVVDNTDVMLWWGHAKHEVVPDEIAKRVQEAVLKGMGIIFLHSAHMSKPFRLLMGTACNLGWRESEDKEKLWCVAPSHPIAQGVEACIELEHEETYSEPFGIPEPDQLIYIGAFQGSEVFRSGCCFNRGLGKVFYFQPGHETYPTYHNPSIQRIIQNAVQWAAPLIKTKSLDCPHLKEIKGF